MTPEEDGAGGAPTSLVPLDRVGRLGPDQGDRNSLTECGGGTLPEGTSR